VLQEKLIKFILATQDEETGGISDRPGDIVSSLTLVFEQLSMKGEHVVKLDRAEISMTRWICALL